MRVGGQRARPRLTLGEVRDEASEVVGLLLRALDHLYEGCQVALDRGEQPIEDKRGGQYSAAETLHQAADSPLCRLVLAQIASVDQV